mgnify:FL=1|tara:strand:+ start:3116 stop:3706 length:591 start_codon:yes stop_codon:yes gene_type:complete
MMALNQVNEVCMLELARLWLKQQHLDNCEQQCAALLKVNANHEECAMLLADLLFQKKDHDAATANFLKLLEKKPNNYLALSKLIKLLRRAGRLDDVPRFLELAECSNARALSHPGLNYCKGLHCRYTNDVVEAVKFFNLARRDGKWGVLALINMIELYLNPDNETQRGAAIQPSLCLCDLKRDHISNIYPLELTFY